ncbi:unnamed protein product [Rodentolepis nana]|uniref:Uncharacterized protein n=1 Tax=Rodentolepis nana TaxID=102285 RepID=A0A0R3TDQ6_RODNA|nr:unnamed protein product [Rodentolepis nana]
MKPSLTPSLQTIIWGLSYGELQLLEMFQVCNPKEKSLMICDPNVDQVY